MLCPKAQAQRIRQLERHQAWLSKNIPSKQVQQRRHRQLIMLRTDLCLRLGCTGADILLHLAAKRTK